MRNVAYAISVRPPRAVYICTDLSHSPTDNLCRSTRVPKFAPVSDSAMTSTLLVPTVDSTRLTALLDSLVRRGVPVMFVGGAGTGKTSLMKSYLSGRSTVDETFLTTTITLNYFMDSASLQSRLDGAIDKRSGRLYVPPHGKRLVLFFDDLNLPYIETYGTQNALSLLRQVIDHRSYYDRSDLGTRRDVADLGFTAAMNPTAGSFTITERLQRCFATFAAAMPSDADLTTIYSSILGGHLGRGAAFASDVRAMLDPLVDATLRMHKSVTVDFLPDAERFTYTWSMRELASVFSGLAAARGELYATPLKLVRLWAHEMMRVYGDRLIDEADTAKFDARLRATAKVVFKDIELEAILAKPLLHTSFAAQPPGLGSDAAYVPLPVGEQGIGMLSKTLSAKLEEYNAAHPTMDLVLFEAAMEHVTRMARILSRPGGHALLIGVGGSGKQSLARLAAYICGLDIRQLSITARFTVVDLNDALKGMIRSAGVKGTGTVFLLTDSQIVNERFLVPINDLLASGWIPDLFERDELDTILGALRVEAKSAGVQTDSPDDMLAFFISRVRANLHVVLCCSPVGNDFRIRARRFPGLVSTTSIDRFTPWPAGALVSVAARFISDLDLGGQAVAAAVAEHMAHVRYIEPVPHARNARIVRLPAKA